MSYDNWYPKTDAPVDPGDDEREELYTEVARLRVLHDRLIAAAKDLIKSLHDFDGSDPGKQIIALQAAIAAAEDLAP